MSDGEVLGYVTLRVPIVMNDDGGDYFSEPEMWIGVGESRLIDYELSDDTLLWLRNDMDSLMNDFTFPAERLMDIAEGAMRRAEREPVPPDVVAFFGADH